jgi:hypothetical protein
VSGVRRALLVLAAALWVLAPGREVSARPGGGHGYSGGSSGGSSGGGSYGGGGDVSWGGSSGGSSSSDGAGGEALVSLVVWVGKNLVALTLAYPWVMWPVWIGVGLGLAFRHHLEDVSLGDWSLGLRKQARAAAESLVETVPSPPPVSMPPVRVQPSNLPRVQLEGLRASDPDFSTILFEDFAHALFAKAHEARGSGGLEALRAYLGPEARATLAQGSEDLAAVEGILVAALRYHAVKGAEGDSPRVRVEFDFDANYTEVPRAPAGRGEPRGMYAVERWAFVRSKSARSRPPERLRSFGCPSCGAPLDSGTAGACAYCGQAFEGGNLDWMVDEIEVLERQRRAPALTSHAPVNPWFALPDTLVAPDLKARRAELEARDPAFTLKAFEARVRHVFAELQPAWSNLDLGSARPYLSDNLFETWRYWIDAYRRAGLRNVSENARIEGMRIARIASDAHYDAITMRLRGEGVDYTVDTNDKLVSGDRATPRKYGEYWTFVRGRGCQGAPRTEKTCPRCGGPLAVNMAGDCASCGARVTSGEFDWVLSRIEQDAAYQG